MEYVADSMDFTFCGVYICARLIFIAQLKTENFKTVIDAADRVANFEIVCVIIDTAVRCVLMGVAGVDGYWCIRYFPDRAGRSGHHQASSAWRRYQDRSNAAPAGRHHAKDWP